MSADTRRLPLHKRARLAFGGAIVGSIPPHLAGFNDDTPWPWIGAALGFIATFVWLRERASQNTIKGEDHERGNQA